jgi:hypothetical protein
LIQIIGPQMASNMIRGGQMGEKQMPSYRVSFINEIPRNEKLFRCCQRVIIIRSARTPERAIEAAKKRFARLEGIRDWGIHASQIEIETIEGKLKLPGAAPPLRKTCPSHKGKLFGKRADARNNRAGPPPPSRA